MSLPQLEQSVGEQLRTAMPQVQAPPELVDQIRRQLAAQPTHRPLPRRPLRRAVPTSSARWVRWVTVAAAVALLVMSGTVQWPGGRRLELTAPMAFAGSLATPLPAQPHWETGWQYRLETELPALPGLDAAYEAVYPADKWLDRARRRLGLALTPDAVGNPGWLGGTPSGWSYNPDSELPASPGGDPKEAEKTAVSWLKKAGLYPSGPVTITSAALADEVQVTIRPAPGSKVAAAGGAPFVSLRIRGASIAAAGGSWPESLRKLDDVALRTADEAWGDLVAGIGVSLVVGAPRTVHIDHPEMVVRQVELSRAMVQSLDYRRYVIPVVLFRGDVLGSDGVRYPAEASVSAVKPQPNQGRYELTTPLPPGQPNAPAVRLQAGTMREWKPTAPLSPITDPANEQAVSEAAREIASLATGLAAPLIREPIVRYSPVEVNVLVPLALATDLPVVQMGGDAHPRFWVSVDYTLAGELKGVYIIDGTAEPAGAPQDLIGAQEAWEKVQGGVGLANIAGRTYPNAHFAAHRTEITRVELAYYEDGTGRAPLQPYWFFYGTAEVGEDHRTLPVVVTVPAFQ
jgi:hypothetical protein